MHADRLQKLRDKKAAIDAQIRDLAARERHQQRKDDTRRKIIIGALTLENLEKNKNSPFAKTILPLLDEYVTRPQDRDLLNAHFETVGIQTLPPLPIPAGEQPSPRKRSSEDEPPPTGLAAEFAGQ